ncbi:hypothetical protein SETIT_1G303200v2 [Setaria italica]|uniref:Uncharacterized protein n=1 Tax=Setaria italica TaxID=4555 RepID=A0A368PR71_SETIT|nr:hypothetical protein SETIT_1G303200v2 [Setaria italica]
MPPRLQQWHGGRGDHSEPLLFFTLAGERMYPNPRRRSSSGYRLISIQKALASHSIKMENSRSLDSIVPAHLYLPWIRVLQRGHVHGTHRPLIPHQDVTYMK